MLLACPIGALGQIEVVNIESHELQDYMADSTYYFDGDYSNSVVSQYIGSGKQVYSRGLDYPQGKKVRWTPSANVSEIMEVRITVSNHQDFSDSVTFVPPMEKQITSYEIRNNFPNRIYYYKVEEFLNNGSVNQVACGVYRTVGQVRMIRVRGAHNMRDLGGWPTQFGVPIKYGYMYRSGNLDKVTGEGIHDLVDNLNVHAELDLRGGLSGERLRGSSPLGDDVDYIQIANDSYVGALQSQGRIYVRDLEWIIARLREGKSVDWHCAVGCDRCGTLSFLIGGLLGMSEVDLCRDYELSSFRGHKRYRSHSGFRNMIPYIKKFGPADDLAQCFYNYWTKNGLSPEDVQFFRSFMLDDYDPMTYFDANTDNITTYRPDNVRLREVSNPRATCNTHNEIPKTNSRNPEMPTRFRRTSPPVPARPADKSALAPQQVPERPTQPAAAVTPVPERPYSTTPASAATSEKVSEGKPKPATNPPKVQETSKDKDKIKKSAKDKLASGAQKDKAKSQDKDKKNDIKPKDKSNPRSNPTVVIVQKGETLTQIARKNGCTVEELKRVNGIKDADKLGIGDKLKIPAKSKGKKK